MSAPALLALVAACEAGPPEPLAVEASAHRAEVDGWHARRVGELAAPDSWLSLIGLHWLDAEETTIGSDPASGIVLPEGRADASVGTFVVADSGRVRFVTAPGARVSAGIDSTLSLPAATGPRPPDTSRDPMVDSITMTGDVGPGAYRVLRHGPFNWIVIHRGDRVAVRLRDNESATYGRFHGLDRYPVDPAWRVTARWVPHEKTVAVPNVLGTVAETESPAYLEFWIDGGRHTLDVTGEPDDSTYMLVFADRTSGSETYGGGRYLWVDAPDADGRVAVDFNLAYNPPCVFSAFATCPLPSRDNRLDVPVTAGEKDWKK